MTTAWIVDPISYGGLAYYDIGLADGLARAGIGVTLVGSDRWLVRRSIDGVSYRPFFAGNRPGRGRLPRGWSYLRGLQRLIEAVSTERPSVVHWQYLELPAFDLLAMTWLAARNVPQVYTAHELLPWRARAYHAGVFGRIYSTVNRVIVHNEADRLALAERFAVEPARVEVIQHGDYRLFATPQLPQAEARRRLGLRADGPIALFFGNLRPSKGLDVLLEAWPEVIRRVAAAHLVVAGRPYKAGGEWRAFERSGIPASTLTVVPEQIDPDRANAFYRAADVVVLPYRSITTSGVLRYAYSSGRCVVATAVGEHISWVRDGETGRLVPTADPVALAAALSEVLADRAMAETMGRAGLRFSEAWFGWSRIGQQTADLYRQIARG